MHRGVKHKKVKHKKKVKRWLNFIVHDFYQGNRIGPCGMWYVITVGAH